MAEPLSKGKVNKETHSETNATAIQFSGGPVYLIRIKSSPPHSDTVTDEKEKHPDCGLFVFLKVMAYINL